MSSSEISSQEATLPEASGIDTVRRLQEVHKHMIELTVHFHARTGHSNSIVEVDGKDSDDRDDGREAVDKCCFSVVENTTLQEVLQLALKEYAATGGAPGCDNGSRLRRYNFITNRVGETYGGRESMALKDLDFSSHEVLMLEHRLESDPPFVEFNPKEMQLRLLVWDAVATQGATVAGAKLATIFRTVLATAPGEDLARVTDLREEAAKVLGTSPGQVLLFANSERVLAELNDDQKTLKKDFDVWPGDQIVVEVVSGAVPAEYASPALAFLRNRRQAIRLFFNHPNMGEEAGDSQSSIYNIALDTSLDRSLDDIKSNIAASLSMSPDRFHLKRNANGTQLKDLSKTLLDLGMVDQSVLHVQLGPGCVLGEHLLRFELDNSDQVDVGGGIASGIAGVCNDYVSLGELPVKEKITVLQLKEQILDNWGTLSAEAATNGFTTVPPKPLTANHIRLRDGKNAQASGPLRNDRILSRCLLGITDGRRIVIQILNEPEVIGADDVILSVRLAAYEGKSLSKPVDLPLARSTTVQQLFEILLNKFPQLNEEPPANLAPSSDPAPTGEEDSSAAAAGAVAGAAAGEEPVEVEPPTPAPVQSRVLAFAKGLPSGPPLTLKSTLKLKFNETAVLERANSSIDRPPLNLRDGSVIVVRGIADFERAKEAIRLKKEAEGPRPISAGTGAAAARAKRPASRGRFPSALPAIKEKGAKPSTGEGTGETPPPPGEKGSTELPTAP